jgi:tRNA A-37 threonylcarbamoyl transferase component Bud32
MTNMPAAAFTRATEHDASWPIDTLSDGAYGVHWQFASGDAARLADVVPSIEGALSAGNLVKNGLHRTVHRLDTPRGTLFVKHDRCSGWRRRARQFLGGSAARREWRKTLAVASRGVPTVTPVALGERRHSGVATDSYFVSEEVPDSQTLERYLTAVLPALPPAAAARARRNLVEALARFTAQVHRAGVFHNDFHAGNLLVRLPPADSDGASGRHWQQVASGTGEGHGQQVASGTGEGHGQQVASGSGDIAVPRLYLLDLAGARLSGPLDWRRSCQSLAMLFTSTLRQATRTDRWRFWKTYLAARSDLRIPDTRAAATQVVARGQRHARRILSGRDDRCLKSNRDFQRLAAADGLAHSVRDFPSADLQRLLADPARPIHEHRHAPRKLSHSSLVMEARLPLADSPVAVAYKRSRDKSWWKAALGRLRALAHWPGGRARRGWQLGHALLERGIATPRPLAMIMPGAGRGESFLATAWIEGALDLHQFAWRLAGLPAAERRRRTRQAAASLGKLIGRMHHWRISHRDLKGCNLLLVERLDGVDAWLIDLDAVRIGHWLSADARARDLARLAASALAHDWLTATDRLRFLRAYLRELDQPGDWRPVWRDVARRCGTLVRSMRRRGQPLA